MLRKNKKLTLFSLVLLTAVSWVVKAQPVLQHHIVVAPECLIKHLSNNDKTLSSVRSSQRLSLIEVDDAGISQLNAAKHHQKEICGGFIDVTDTWNQFNVNHPSAINNAKTFLTNFANPPPSLHKTKTQYDVKYEAQVNPLMKKINQEDIWADLTKLSSYKDRYANSSTGVEAATWIETQVKTIATNNGRSDVTVYTIATGRGYKQKSVVAKIGNASGPGIVIGAHMDTLSINDWMSPGIKPGADDDGSGTVSSLEAARILLSSGMHFKKPIYFIWYSAEEEGLIGSQSVVKEFKNIPVDAVLQLDMTGYADKNDPTIWLISDYVNAELTTYLKTLIRTYVKQPIGDPTKCGYACSDHATWNKAGFAVAFPVEAKFGSEDPYLHTSQDTMDLLSPNHMADFAKLAIAFAVELAEPIA
jgi:bacterial leucyl aminopeptidase